jgi:hypothetical protein
MVSETSNHAPKGLPVTPVPPTKLPPGSHARTAPNAAVAGAVSSADRPDVLLQADRESSEHTLATAPSISAAHPDVVLQASQFADHPLQQDLHGTTPLPPPPAAASSTLRHAICHITYALLLPTPYRYCIYTHYVLYSLCAVLPMYCTNTPNVLYCRHSPTHPPCTDLPM